MASNNGLPGIPRAQYLLQRYHRRIITLEECYELLRWLEEVYFRNPTIDDAEKLRAVLVQAGVNAKRVDLEAEQHLCP